MCEIFMVQSYPFLTHVFCKILNFFFSEQESIPVGCQLLTYQQYMLHNEHVLGQGQGWEVSVQGSWLSVQ